MRGEVVVGLNKEMLQKLEEHVGSNNVHKIACAIKKMVVEFFRSPHELKIDGKIPRPSALRVRVRPPKSVYNMLKEYANRRMVPMASVVRAIIAERLGLDPQNREEKKRNKLVRRDGETLTVVTFKIEKGLLEKVDLVAMNRGVSRSEIIRWALSMVVHGYTTHVVTREI